jgi:hypothetical protein
MSFWNEDDVVEYTKKFDVVSSVIEGVYFNENDNTVVLDVNDTLYKYDNVGGLDVGALAVADSVGAYYNQTFKKKFGPAEQLGDYDEFDFVQVAVDKETATAGVAKDLTDNTKEYSLSLPDPEPVVLDDPSVTKEFSLSFDEIAPEVPAPLEGVKKITVHFTLDGYDRVYKYVANALTVEDSIEQLHHYVSALGARGKVKKVVVKFV